MKKETIILALTVLLIISIIFSRNNTVLTENIYIVNTYLYVLLAIMISTVTILYTDEHESIFLNNGWFGIIALITISFGSLFGVLLTTNDQIVLKHISYCIFAMSIGLLCYFAFDNLQKNGKLVEVLYKLIAMMVILSVLGYVLPGDQIRSWEGVLGGVLLCLIVIQLLDIIIGNYFIKGFESRLDIYSYIGIALFSGFIIYDTRKILDNANETIKLCQLDNKQLCADYPKESLGLFLDIANLFQKMSRVHKN
jgi:FtsH-binding integral membrane protein